MLGAFETEMVAPLQKAHYLDDLSYGKYIIKGLWIVNFNKKGRN